MPKTVLITGACGFIGNNLCKYILENTDMTIMALDTKHERILGDANGRIINYRVDISRKNELLKITEKFNYAIHLAAEKDVTMSYVNIEPYILTNVLGTARFFEWLVGKDSIEKIINFSTAAVLGANKGIYAHEHAHYDPMSPYASSKASQEIIGNSYRNIYKLPIVTVRIDTPFGPYQPERNFIPITIKNILNNKKVILYKKNIKKLDKNGEYFFLPASRHWIFIDSLSKELVDIITDKKEDLLYHICGRFCDIKKLFEKIDKLLGSKSEIDWVNCNEYSQTSDQHLEYSLSSIHPDLRGYVTDDIFDEQIEKTVTWYKKYFKGGTNDSR
jgi:dTDP-glucose 4,6-dehydratase